MFKMYDIVIRHHCDDLYSKDRYYLNINYDEINNVIGYLKTIIINILMYVGILNLLLLT